MRFLRNDICTFILTTCPALVIVAFLIFISRVNDSKAHGGPRGHNNPWTGGQNWNNDRNPTVIVIQGGHQRGGGCPYPSFTDKVIFSLENCEGDNKEHPVCNGRNVRVPVDWRGTMLCRSGSITLKFESVCGQRGVWRPHLFQSCSALLQDSLKKFEDPDLEKVDSFSVSEHKNSRPPFHHIPTTDLPLPIGEGIRPFINSEKEIPCATLRVPQDDRFVFTCLFPGSSEHILDCGPDSTVPSRTTALLNCKSPYVSKNGEPNSWLCRNGKWTGESNQLLCISTNFVASKDEETTGEVPSWFLTAGSTTTTTTTTTERPTTSSSTTTTPKPTTTTTTTPKPTTKSTTTTTQTPKTTPKVDPIKSRPPSIATNINPVNSQISFDDRDRPLIDIRTTNPSVVRCPPLLLKSPGVQIECTNKQWDGHVSTGPCNASVSVGSEARYFCEPFYETTAGLSTLFRRCKADGTWTGSSEQFGCVVQCGRTAGLARTPFITHGLPTHRGLWPWNAAVLVQETKVQSSSNWQFICGGSLISGNAILTAAHCVTILETVTSRKWETLRVDLGKYQRDVSDEIVQTRSVKEILVHPAYNPYSFDSDIAILVLNNPVKLSHHVQPVCFPQSSDSAVEQFQLEENSVGTIVGWGKDEQGKLSQRLMSASLPVVSQRKCVGNLGLNTALQTRSTTFCAGFNNGTNVCSGDSGAGMVFPSKNTDSTRWYLQGIVSVGVSDERGNCDPTKYSVFTRVGRYADWIVRQLSEADRK